MPCLPKNIIRDKRRQSAIVAIHAQFPSNILERRVCAVTNASSADDGVKRDLTIRVIALLIDLLAWFPFVFAIRSRVRATRILLEKNSKPGARKRIIKEKTDSIELAYFCLFAFLECVKLCRTFFRDRRRAHVSRTAIDGRLTEQLFSYIKLSWINQFNWFGLIQY